MVLHKVVGERVPASALLISNILYKAFGYDKENVIYNLINEYADYGFLRPFGIGVLRVRTFDNVQMHAMPKLSFYLKGMIEEGGILNDIAYINMCAIRTLVNKDAVSREGMAFFNVRNLHRDGKIEWVVAKIMNAISFLRLVLKVNNLEERNLKMNKLGRYEQEILIKANCFERTRQMAESITEQLKAIVNEMSDDLNTMKLISNKLEKYINNW